MGLRNRQRNPPRLGGIHIREVGKINMRREMGITVLVIALLVPGSVHAASVGHDDYSVTYVESDSQRPSARGVGYADVIAAPGSAQTLRYQIQNISAKTIKVDMTKGTAGSSENGSVVYTTENWPNKDFVNLPTRMENHLTVDEPVITLAPGQIKTVTAQLSMPDTAFEGTIAGGVGFKEENQYHTASTQYRLNAQVKYDIAVLAQNTEPKIYNMQPSVVSEGAKVIDGQAGFVFHFQNPYPAFINRVKMDVEITSPSGKKYHRVQTMMQLAPNTRLNWTVWLGGDKVEAGTYRVSVNGSAAEPATLVPGAITKQTNTDKSSAVKSVGSTEDKSSAAPENELTVPDDQAASAQSSVSVATSEAQSAGSSILVPSSRKLKATTNVPISTAQAKRLNSTLVNAGQHLNPIITKALLGLGTLAGFLWFLWYKRRHHTVYFYTEDAVLVAKEQCTSHIFKKQMRLDVPEGFLAVKQDGDGESVYDVTGQPVLVPKVAVDYRQESQTFTVIAKSGKGADADEEVAN